MKARRDVFAALETDARSSHARPRKQSVERLILVPHPREVRVGHGVVGPIRRHRERERHQPAGLADGQLSEDDRIEQRKDRGGRADAEGQRSDGEHGEHAIAAQQPQRESQILHDRLERGQPPHRARDLDDAWHISEITTSGRAGLVGRHPGLHAQPFFLCEVKGDLVGQVAVVLWPAPDTQLQPFPRALRVEGHRSVLTRVS